MSVSLPVEIHGSAGMTFSVGGMNWDSPSLDLKSAACHTKGICGVKEEEASKYKRDAETGWNEHEEVV